MTNYTKTTTFTAGNNVIASQLDTEFNNLQTASATKQDTSAKGQPNGYAGLDGSGLVPSAQLPSSATTNSFETMLVTDTDSGFTWSETGSAVATVNTDTLTLVSGTGVDIDVDPASQAIRIAAAGGAVNFNDPDNYAFKTVNANGTNLVADSNTDTLTILPGTGISVTGAAGSDTVTIAGSSASTTAPGVVELATQAEAEAASSTTLALTPNSATNFAKKNTKNGWTAGEYTTPDAVAAASTTNLDAALSNVFDINLSTSISTLNLNNMSNGQTIVMVFRQQGSNTVTFPAAWEFPAGITPTVTSGAGAVDIVSAIQIGGIVYATFSGDYS